MQEHHDVEVCAKWIADEVENQFGSQGSCLIDLYHLCDYLVAATPEEAESAKSWVDTRKADLKEGRVQLVIDELRSRLESPEVSNDEAPVRKCHRYMINREGQFFYQEAMEKALPIGSGEIESAHYYIVQNRLKLAGAWWTTENAEGMLALRIVRANGGWEGYWRNHANPDEELKMVA